MSRNDRLTVRGDDAMQGGADAGEARFVHAGRVDIDVPAIANAVAYGGTGAKRLRATRPEIAAALAEGLSTDAKDQAATALPGPGPG